MKRAVGIPVTVKCRIGIDDQDPEIALDALARSVVARRRGCADRACPQGLAQRIVAEGKPRHPAARLRQGVPAEGVDAGCARHHQRRHRRSRRGEAAPRPCRRRDAGAGGLSGAVAIAGGRSRIVRRGGAVRDDEGRVRGDDSLYRGSAGAGHAAAFDDAAFRRRVSRRARRARLPPPSRRERRQAGRRRQRAARCDRAGARTARWLRSRL